jgi:alkanesulfonate monooxygenase SsuD/methylene tetrahydromethanopterin reductase-like flavin-dependent oxidoreductase (luciferase family)
MKIGMNVPIMAPGLDRKEILAWCRGIDEGPYSSLGVGERINFPNPAAMPILSVAAAVTERVEIMSYVLIMPMHNAVNRAKELATIDIVSNGRLCLGVGAGAREEDYRAVGASFGKRRLSQLEEQVAIMKRVWAGEIVVEGPLLPVGPAPVQPGGPEILVASLSEAAIKHVSRWADGIAGFSFGPSIQEIETTFERARRFWRESNREAEPRLVTSFWFALGNNARGQLDDYLHRYLNFFGQEASKQLAKSVKLDSPGALRDMIRRVEDTGADEVSLVPTTRDPAELERVSDAMNW